MEFPAGTGVALAEMLRGDPMRVEDLLAVAEALAGIVAAAHRRGVIHKDINPGNIVMSGPSAADDRLYQAKDEGRNRVCASPESPMP